MKKEVQIEKLKVMIRFQEMNLEIKNGEDIRLNKNNSNLKYNMEIIEIISINNQEMVLD